MSLTDIIEKKIRAERNARFRELHLPAEFIAPNYRGRSIVNVAASILTLFGARIPTPPLDANILADLADGVERVVLVVVDALGYQRMLDTLNANPQNGFHALLRAGARLVPLTSEIGRAHV